MQLCSRVSPAHGARHQPKHMALARHNAGSRSSAALQSATVAVPMSRAMPCSSTLLAANECLRIMDRAGSACMQGWPCQQGLPASWSLDSARPFIWSAMLCRVPSVVRRLFRRFVISLRARTECSSSLPFPPFSDACTCT